MQGNTLKPTTYIIDFDSTLITLESLDELARIALADRADKDKVVAELEAITKQGMAGEIGFDESLSRRLKLFSANKQHVQKVVKLIRQHISPSVQSNAAWFRKHADHIYIVSGGFSDYIVPIATELNLRSDHVFANSFTYDSAGNITGFDTCSALCKPQGKVHQVNNLDLSKNHVVVIGDGYTDYEVKHHGAANEFWAYTETISRPKVTSVADKVLRSFAEVATA